MRIIKHDDGLQIQISLAQKEHLEYHEELNYRHINGSCCAEITEEGEDIDTDNTGRYGVRNSMSGCKNGNTIPTLMSSLSRVIIPRTCRNPLAPQYNSRPYRVFVTNTARLCNMNIQVTDLTISSNCCNDLNALDLNRFKWLRSIEIGDECFRSVVIFKIDGLNRLKTIKIGNNSFTEDKNWWGNDDSKSFQILNCESLESIEIGEYSFSDYAGVFEFNNLSNLKFITFGNSVLRDFTIARIESMDTFT